MSRIITRREALVGIAATSALAGCNRVPGWSAFLKGIQRWNEHFEAMLFSPDRIAPQAAADEITNEDAFPAYYISSDVPQAPAGWALKVGGMVAHPASFTLADLTRMEHTEMRVRHHCVEGWSAVATWQGVRVSEIARIAGVDPRFRYVEFRSFDSGYWSSWDRASAMHPQSILAYGMNGHPLGPGHGAPLRLYSAVKLGYKMVKYLTAVNFLSDRTGGYWEDQGYDWFAGV